MAGGAGRRRLSHVDPTRVAVTGGSYGGGESWMQASQAEWTFPHWKDPTLPVLDLQVAVPKYPWTDLAYSLAPVNENGPENLTAWNTRIAVTGDPYLPGDPILDQASKGLTILRSAYYQPAWPTQVARREVAVFSIQGWTDDLFEPIESFRMFKYSSVWTRCGR